VSFQRSQSYLDRCTFSTSSSQILGLTPGKEKERKEKPTYNRTLSAFTTNEPWSLAVTVSFFPFFTLDLQTVTMTPSETALLEQYNNQIVPRSFNAGFVALSYVVSFIGAGSTLELLNRRTGPKGRFNQ
jgi:hypothetical protein